METARRLGDEQERKAVRYVGAIFLSGAGLWGLLTLLMVISPPSNTTLCGDEAAMCCWPCAAFAWFTIVPFLGFLVALILGLPGFLLVSLIARKAGWWRPVYWIPGWVLTGVIAAAILAACAAIADRKLIALNINNGILARMVRDFGGFALEAGFFGLLCGICYWLLRDWRSAEANRSR